MNKHRNKLLIPLFLASSFLLAGCSSGDIVARPSWIDESIISNVITKDNTMKEIYDAVKAIGTVNSDILNKVLYEIAEKQIGNYADDKNTGIKGLSTFYNDYDIDALTTAQYNEIEKFVNKFTIYKATTDTGFYSNDGGKNYISQKLSREQKLKISLSLMQETYKEIEDQVYEALYNEIKGGSYNYGNQKNFSEEKYINTLYKDMKIDNMASQYASDMGLKITNGHDETKSGHFTYKNNYSEGGWQGYLETQYDSNGNWEKGFLTIKYGEDGEAVDNIFDSHIYGKYIKNTIIKNVYRNLLIQNYVKQQRYQTIGRSYAREINMISYTTTSEYFTSITSMFSEFAQDNIVGKDSYDFEVLADCIKGFYRSSGTTGDEKYLMNHLNRFQITLADDETDEKPVKYTSKVLNKTFNVYKGTKLYDLVKDIVKVKADTTTTPTTKGGDSTGAWDRDRIHPDKTVYDSITNNGAYTWEEGVKIKEREIIATNLIKDGWQLKSGVSELTDDYKSKLFNISSSNIVDDYDRKSGTKAFDPNLDYVRYINGNTGPKKAFLVDSGKKLGTEAQSITISDSNKVSIVEIKNAVSTSKCSLTSKSNYAHIIPGIGKDNAYKSISNMNTIVNGALKVTSNTDTYKKNANQYYLMISNIIIHDTSVYNYFKSQFPDLFK